MSLEAEAGFRNNQNITISRHAHTVTFMMASVQMRNRYWFVLPKYCATIGNRTVMFLFILCWTLMAKCCCAVHLHGYSLDETISLAQMTSNHEGFDFMYFYYYISCVIVRFNFLKQNLTKSWHACLRNPITASFLIELRHFETEQKFFCERLVLKPYPVHKQFSVTFCLKRTGRVLEHHPYM